MAPGSYRAREDGDRARQVLSTQRASGAKLLSKALSGLFLATGQLSI
jgi:hypothetical protein